jgi:poly-beta-1,6-N-acetyl-D-glucosamine biosynthesis protein PgaD
VSAKRSDDGLIIDVPEQLSRVRRAAQAGMKGVAVVLWLVALRPILLLGIWYLGWQVAYTHMVKLQGWDNREYFALLGSTAAALSLALLAWNRYNARRFRAAERRRARRVASVEELATRFELPPAAIEQLRESRHVRVERPSRTEVVLSCEEGAVFVGRHDPLGPRPRRTRLPRGTTQQAPGPEAISDAG